MRLARSTEEEHRHEEPEKNCHESVMERLGERLEGVTIDIQPWANDSVPSRLQVEKVGGAE